LIIKFVDLIVFIMMKLYIKLVIIHIGYCKTILVRLTYD